MRVGIVMLACFVLMATVGPWVVPLDMTPDHPNRFLPPSSAHVLGTDYAGRDIFAQIVHGSTDILLIAFSAGAAATALALLVGLSAGLLGGRFDTGAMALVDVVLTVPSFPVMAILAAVFRIASPIEFGLVLALWSWPGMARAVRTQVLALKRKEFVEVARIMDLHPTHIMAFELLPNLLPFISINFIHMAKGAITASVGIMLLGLVPLRVQNWGMMLNLAAFQTGAVFVPHAWSYLLSPLCAIVLFQYALIAVARGLDDAPIR